jgi:PAS domain S-box-containing protein
VLGVFAAARDVTERKRAEEDLDRLFNLTPEFVCVAGMDGYFKRVNPTFMRVLGYAEDELLSMPFAAFIHPEDVDATGDVVVQLGTGNTIIAFDNRYRCKDGSYRWLSWNAVPVPEEGVMYCVARDVTAEKRVDEINSARLRLLEFATAHSVDELLQRTLDEAEELSGSSIGFCHFVDDDQERLRLETWSTRTMMEFCKAEGVHRTARARRVGEERKVKKISALRTSACDWQIRAQSHRALLNASCAIRPGDSPKQGTIGSDMEPLRRPHVRLRMDSCSRK